MSQMNRMTRIALAVIPLLAVVVLAGCGGKPLDAVNPTSLVGGWYKTYRSVDGIRELPILGVTRYEFHADGTYAGTDSGNYFEGGTWSVTGANLVVKMLTNNQGNPNTKITAEIELVDATHLNFRDTIDTGGGTKVLVLETWLRNP